ncbi:hypothetical protein [Propionivibrio sp.]|uniref:hypothetical protein n=1 Tax=Propionivibrio sp. TaxID=2212460 RepID=UPI0039E35230
MATMRVLDICVASAIAIVMVIAVILRGDALYLGLWYYIAVPTLILGVCIAIRPAPLFLSGTAVVIAASMVALMAVNWTQSSPEGLLGLGHIFSLPGAVIATVIVASVARKKCLSQPIALFLLGLGGYGTGYFLNQLVVCNTVMWCGPLSLSIK